MSTKSTETIVLLALLASFGPGSVFHFSCCVSGQICGETTLISSPSKANLSSPGLGSYGPNLNCSWTITASPGLAVELTITSFMLQDSPSCLADSLTIYDGDSTSDGVLFGPECGSNIQWPVYPTTIVSTGSVITIMFTTDASVNEAGFQMTYQQVSLREEFFLITANANRAIYKLNKLGQNYETVVTELSQPTGVDFDPVERKVYFADTGSNTINRVNIDGSDREIFPSGFISHPFSLAVDHVLRFLYWICNNRGTITRASLDGSNRTILISTGTSRPYDIVISNELGYIFWSEYGSPSMIERDRKDGTGREAIISTDLVFPFALALDYYENKLYWADGDLDKIERSEFDGSQRELIKLFQENVNPHGLVIFKNAIYWSDLNTGMIHVSDRDFKHNSTSLQIDGVTTRLWGLVFYSSVNETDTNKCESGPCLNGGACTDVVDGYTCMCVPGFEGANCETDIDECASDPCLSGGTCKDMVHGFTCMCLPGLQGANCETGENIIPESKLCPNDVQVVPVGDQIILAYTTPNCTGNDMNAGIVTCEPAAGVFLNLFADRITCTCTGTADPETTRECQVQSTPDPLMCPVSMSITPTQGVASVEVTYLTPNCTNDEGLVFNAICQPASGRNFTVGVSTEVGCFCSDTGQRIDDCAFTVTVLDPSTNQLITWIALSVGLIFLLLLVGTAMTVYCIKNQRKKTPKDIPMTNQSPPSTRPATVTYDEPDEGFSNRGLDQDQVPTYERDIHPTPSLNQRDHWNTGTNAESTYYISPIN